MAKKMKKDPIKIELTPEQREQIKRATGRDVPVLELAPDVLEERIAPAGTALVLNWIQTTEG